MAAHEVLSGMKKGSRRHCLRLSETLSRWQMLQGGKGRAAHTACAEASQQFAGGCQSLHGSESNQPNLWKKNPFGIIKNESIISGQEFFGPQMVAVCKHFWEAPVPACPLLMLCLQDLLLATARDRVTSQEALWSVYSWFLCITHIQYLHIWGKTPKAIKHLLEHISSPTRLHFKPQQELFIYRVHDRNRER